MVLRPSVSQSCTTIVAAECLAAPETAGAAVEIWSTEGRLRSVLDTTPIFRGLPEHVLRDMAAAAQLRRVPASASVIDGEHDHGVFVAIEGQLAVICRSGTSSVVTVAELGPGCCFGELAAITGTVGSASIVALQPSLVAEISRVTFRRVLSDQPLLAGRVLEMLAGRLNAIDRRLAQLAAHDEAIRRICLNIFTHTL